MLKTEFICWIIIIRAGVIKTMWMLLFYTSILYKYFKFEYYQILLYERYADNFNCPKDLLEQAWQWYREKGYTFMEED